MIIAENAEKAEKKAKKQDRKELEFQPLSARQTYLSPIRRSCVVRKIMEMAGSRRF